MMRFWLVVALAGCRTQSLEPADPCVILSQPCDLQAICRSRGDFYTCVCKAGFIGDGQHCDLEPDAGLPSPGDAGAFDAGASDGAGPPPLEIHTERALGVAQRQTCALARGKAFCWGSTEQLGAGLTSGGLVLASPRGYSTPVFVGGEDTLFDDWTRLAVGSFQSCGLRADASLWCWGYPTTVTSPAPGPAGRFPEPVRAPSERWQAVAASDHTCAVSEGGALYCWSVWPSSSAALQLGADRDWRDVATGGDSDCGFRTDGSLWCWRTAHDLEPAGAPAQVSGDFRAASPGKHHICALDGDGHVFCWRAAPAAPEYLWTGPSPGPSTPTPVAGADYRLVSSGLDFSCALRADRTLWCMGSLPSHTARVLPVPTQIGSDHDWDGLALGDGYATSSNNHACARKLDGRIFCFGANGLGQLGNERGPYRTLPTRLGDPGIYWLNLSLGAFSYVCGVQTDGSLWCWGGTNTSSSLSPGSQVPVRVGGDSAWTRVSVGSTHACALRGAGELWCWGDNSQGQLGDNTTTASSSPKRIGGDADWTAVSTGTLSTCGVRGGQLFCWGLDATPSEVHTPTLIGLAGDRWTRVASYNVAVCAVRSDGALYCWGRFASGMVQPSDLIPARVGSDSDWREISLGGQSACGIRGSGHVYCFGQALDGRVSELIQTDPQYVYVAGTSGIVSQGVSVGVLHACAWRTDRVDCWGNDFGGQLGDGSYAATRASLGFQGVEELSLGGYASCARLHDGTAYCWGVNGSGQLGNAGVWSDDLERVPASPL